jgi:hypothetical protein
MINLAEKLSGRKSHGGLGGGVRKFPGLLKHDRSFPNAPQSFPDISFVDTCWFYGSSSLCKSAMGHSPGAKHARVVEQPTSGIAMGRKTRQWQDVEVITLIAVFLIRSPIDKP